MPTLHDVVVLTARFFNLADQNTCSNSTTEAPIDPEAGATDDRPHKQGSGRQKQHRLNPDDVQRLIADYQSGQSVTDLAHRWSLHRTTVMAHLKRHDVPTRRHRRKMNDDQVSEAADLYRAGASLATLGQRYCVDAQTVSRELKAIGVTIRPPGRSG